MPISRKLARQARMNRASPSPSSEIEVEEVRGSVLDLRDQCVEERKAYKRSSYQAFPETQASLVGDEAGNLL